MLTLIRSQGVQTSTQPTVKDKFENKDVDRVHSIKITLRVKGYWGLNWTQLAIRVLTTKRWTRCYGRHFQYFPNRGYLIRDRTESPLQCSHNQKLFIV